MIGLIVWRHEKRQRELPFVGIGLGPMVVYD